MLAALAGPIAMVSPPLLLLHRPKGPWTVPVNAVVKGGSIQLHVHGQLVPIFPRRRPALSLGLPQQLKDRVVLDLLRNLSPPHAHVIHDLVQTCRTQHMV